MIRLLIVDDHPLVLDGITACLEEEENIEVIGQASNGQEAVEKAHALRPDVVLMDISMPVMTGLEATVLLTEQLPDCRVLILSMHDETEYIVKIMQAGAAGYVLKDVAPRELLYAIETVHSNNTYFSSKASQMLLKTVTHPQEPQTPITEQPSKSPLTAREKTILTEIAMGKGNKEIASLLNISIRTVETHRQNIKGKLDIHTTAGLTKYALRHGLA